MHPRTDSATIAAVATALPPCRLDQQSVFPLIKLHYGDMLKPRSMTVLEQVLAHRSIRNRYVSVDSPADIARIKTESIDERMERFTRWSVDLCGQAVTKALDKAGLAPGDVAALVVNTCTGYICPGISTYLIERLGLAESTRAYDLVGAGCGAALPSLQTGEALLRVLDRGVVVCAAVEICSATYEMDNDISLLISNAIFGDGAAAAVLTSASSGLTVQATASRFLPANRDDVRFVYKNGRLHNRLSPALPDITGREVSAFVKNFLDGNGLRVQDVDHWAIHPGGDKILNALQERLGLPDKAMAVSREVLADCGNMSSPTVLFELERIMEAGVGEGRTCLMVAFGAGMSMHAVLLRGRA